jgi:pimeloyl-ACP methyl ester carboxylesterase
MKPRVLIYDIAGEGNPLILVPGGLTGWVSWIPHQERLSQRHRAIRVQPIHNELGTAGKPGDPSYTRETERESLRLTLDHLEIEEADFAGWSSGGKALIDFTAVYSSRVRSLTLVEPAAYWILKELGETDPRLERGIQYMRELAGTTVTEDDLAFFLSSAGFVPDPSEARQDAYWDRAVPHRMTLSWLSELLASDLSVADLAGIRCPVLLTKGTTTEPWEKRVVDVLGARLPDARVVELEGSHAHHIESLEPFLEALETHLMAASTI